MISAVKKALAASRYRWARHLYWSLRAQEIHRTWGAGTTDYTTLTRVIELVQPKRLLDVGCGSGRLFPLYHQLGVEEVVGQDIAASAISICRERFPDFDYQLICTDIEKLSFPIAYFDLTISNRALSAVPPTEIASVLGAIARMTTHFYCNELSDSDGCRPSRSWFKHDYVGLLAPHHFSVIDTGTINEIDAGKSFVQTWVLFKKTSE